MISKLNKKAIEAAIKAGKLLKEGFGETFRISNKEGINNLVTEYDFLSEELIINLIKKEFPEHSFLAEEGGGQERAGKVKLIKESGTESVMSQLASNPGNRVERGKRKSEKDSIKNALSVRWIIDPLDGTVNFAHRIPIFSVSIAAECEGKIMTGVVYNPMLDELFSASIGGGAYLNGKIIEVSKCSELNKSILVTGFPYNVKKNPRNAIDHFVNIIKRGIPVRRFGSAALDLAYVATGRFEGFWEVNLHPWDVAAGIILIEEAGGKVSQFDKSEYIIGGDNILASNGRIHNELSNVIMFGERYNF